MGFRFTDNCPLGEKEPEMIKKNLTFKGDIIFCNSDLFQGLFFVEATRKLRQFTFIFIIHLIHLNDAMEP